MTLKILNHEIIGKIDKLDEKLEGKLPITREELLVLVNSWGREQDFKFIYDNQTINFISIKKSKPKECYDLSRFQTVFVKTNTCSRAMLTN